MTAPGSSLWIKSNKYAHLPFRITLFFPHSLSDELDTGVFFCMNTVLLFL